MKKSLGLHISSYKDHIISFFHYSMSQKSEHRCTFFYITTHKKLTSISILAQKFPSPQKILWLPAFQQPAHASHSHRKNVPSLRRFTPRTASNRLRQIAPRDFVTFPPEQMNTNYWMMRRLISDQNRDPGWIDIFSRVLHCCYLPSRHYARYAVRG